MKRFLFLIILLAGCRTEVAPVVSPANVTAVKVVEASTNSTPLPPLPPAPAAAVSAMPRALVVHAPQAAVKNQYLRPVVLGFDPPTNTVATGVVAYAGNQSGRYLLRQTGPLTNTFTFTALDMRLPWFFAVAECLTNTTPVSVFCYTNNGRVACVTNYIWESQLSNEASLVNSNALPYLSITNGTASLLGYGASGVTYTVCASSNVAGPWNPIYLLAGTNGPWLYTEPMNGNMKRFFKTTYTP